MIEEQIIHLFKNAYESEAYPIISELNLRRLSARRATIQDIDDDIMFDKVKSEFQELGKLVFSFDSASGGPAIKQLRHKLLMGGIGAINFEMDEMGSNMVGNGEALNTFLELFDVGKVKQKLIKNTKENTRSEEIDGRTPTNLLMFGTPSKLFDGSKIEEEFYSALETGYARRCIFGFSKKAKKNIDLTAEEVFDITTDPATNKYLKDVAIEFGKLADVLNHNKKINVSRQVSILIIEYRMYCEALSDLLGEHESIAKAEMSHRYFKALKIAGVYAFNDGHTEITEDNYYHAICMVEKSGEAFEQILSRDRVYVKLAKYLGACKTEVTHVELCEDLPFYRGSASVKQDLINLAAAWGYKNHIVIKRSVVSGIEFLSGEALEKVNLEKLFIAYSDDIADGYANVQAPWKQLHKLTQLPMQHWINHHSVNGHRSGENIIPGFDIVVLDVDTGITIKEVLLLLDEYELLIYTTKRHTNTKHRFRIVMPINYHLKLSSSEYRGFMSNIFEWLPFKVDDQTSQRSRKWLSHAGQHHYHHGGTLLDSRLFIPKTKKNDERTAFNVTWQSMTNMERWFLDNSSNNRNNQLSRYALLMVDLGYSPEIIKENILAMNDKLPDKLTIKELNNTVIASAMTKIRKLATLP